MLDKKAETDAVNFVLIKDIGKAEVVKLSYDKIKEIL